MTDDVMKRLVLTPAEVAAEGAARAASVTWSKHPDNCLHNELTLDTSPARCGLCGTSLPLWGNKEKP